MCFRRREKIKVLHIIDSGGFYGAEMMLLNLVQEQIRIGFEPIIASIGKREEKEKKIEAEATKLGLQLKTFRMRSGLNVIGAFSILNYAKNSAVDILHSHGYKGNILIGFLPRKIRKLPLITTVHGWTSTNGFSKMRLYEWLDRKSLKMIDAVVLVNRGMLYHSSLTKLRQQVDFKIVNNGIADKELYVKGAPQNNESSETIKNFCKKGFTIGAIGRLSPEKGFNFLIDALSQLLNMGIDLRGIIIGEGRMRSELEAQIKRRGLENRILMPGFLNAASHYMSFFDLIAIPSLTEGLPITLLEAMRAQLPIVASNVGGIPEVLKDQDCGLLVEPKNISGLVKAIYSIYTDKQMAKRFSVKARKVFLADFTREKMARAYAELYLRVVSTC